MGITRVSTDLDVFIDTTTQLITSIIIKVNDIGQLVDKNGLILAKDGRMVVAPPPVAGDVAVLLSKTGVILATAKAAFSENKELLN